MRGSGQQREKGGGMGGGKKEILANQISWQHIVFCPDKATEILNPLFIVKVKKITFLFFFYGNIYNLIVTNRAN